MADFMKNLFGGAQAPMPAQQAAPEDIDFADFAGVPEPSPVELYADAASTMAQAATVTPGAWVPYDQRPYTKWYTVWERVTLADFYSELFILPFIIGVVLIHLWGTRRNRRKAKSWLAAHGPVLQQEFALVGFERRPVPLVGLESNDLNFPQEILKEKAANEYISYASGRLNIAFTDIKLTLAKNYNPMGRLAEEVIGFIFESQPAPRERMEATSFLFDGKEADTLALTSSKGAAEEGKKEKFHSTYDNFVWAVVHKDAMKRLRDGRYDLSLTTTKDHPKLPNWATVMSENAEITDTLLTPDFIKALKDAGDECFEALIVTDQPIDKPRTLDETLPKKRLSLSLRLPSGAAPSAASYASHVPIFTSYIRLADTLAASAHFRPEVLRRIRATREDEAKKIKKVGETEKAEERRIGAEKEKKKERDEKLKNMSAEEQRKFLERERATEMRRGQKKKTVR